MRSGAVRFCVSPPLLSLVSVVMRCRRRAADAPAPATNDPRVGLKPGLHDAGEAAAQHGTDREPAEAGRLLRSEGAGGQSAPRLSGAPTPRAARRRPRRRAGGSGHAPAPAPFDPVASNRLGFTNSDLAFSGNHVIVGNYHGFNTYDVERPNRPKLLASVVCPGGQGDVSVYGNLLFMSVEQTRGRLDCGTQGVQTPVSAERFRGVRIFDITDVNKPKQVAAIQTCRGSHTHTLVTDPNDKANLYVYGSGTSSVRSAEELAGCSGLDAKEDPNTSLFSIDVIKVPLAAPQNAKIVNRPRIFADAATGNIAGLWQGGNHGEGTQTSRMTNQCHDITVFPEVGLAAGACSGNGILLDISRSDEPGPARSRRATRASPTGIRRRSTTTARRWSSPTSGAAAAGRAAARSIRRRGAPTRSSTSSIASCASRAISRCRRRRPSRRTASRTTAR